MNKLFFIKVLTLLVQPIYYLIHYNFFFGLFQKNLIKEFNYKKMVFRVDYERIPTSLASSFLFNTYEYNDRILVEKYIDKKNKSIIIGGGLGFIACINFKKSKNEFIISEIDKTIIKNLEFNLKKNNCRFKLIKGNLLVKKKKEYDKFFIGKNFISNSKYIIKQNSISIKNFQLEDVCKLKKYNTLIIDGEGVEEHYIKNLNYLPNIKYIIFELHYNILSKSTVDLIFKQLNKKKFKLIDNCFNSFYFRKDV